MQRIVKVTAICLAVLLVSQSCGLAAGRNNSAMMKKLYQAQAQQAQAYQKAAQEAAARQAAIEAHKREMHAKASKARHDKEEADRAATLERLKAQQASTPSSTSTKTETPKKDK